MHRLLVLVVAVFLASSGAMAQDGGKMDKNMGRIFFSGFPPGATVIVDGRDVGKIGDEKMTPVAVSQGTHMVAVKDGNRSLMRQRIYIEKGKDRLLKK